MKTVFVVLFKSFYKYEGTEYPITSDTKDVSVFSSLSRALDHVSENASQWQRTGYDRLPYWEDEDKTFYHGGQRVQKNGTAAVWEVSEIPVD